MANLKVSDLVYQPMSTGVIVKDKSRMRGDDHLIVAHINKLRHVLFLTVKLTQQQKDAITHYSTHEDPEHAGRKVFYGQPVK